MPKNSLNEDSQDNQVEHIQANVQDGSVQEDRCYKAPVLPFQNRIIIFCSVRDKHIAVLTIRKCICQKIAQCMCPGSKSHLVSSQTPHHDRDQCNYPRKPGDTFKPLYLLMPVYRSSIA